MPQDLAPPVATVAAGRAMAPSLSYFIHESAASFFADGGEVSFGGFGGSSAAGGFSNIWRRSRLIDDAVRKSFRPRVIATVSSAIWTSGVRATLLRRRTVTDCRLWRSGGHVLQYTFPR